MKKSLILICCLVGSLHLCFAGPITLEGLPMPVARAQTPAQQAYAHGYEALTRGELASASASFQESLAADKNFVPALLGFADVFIRQNNAEEAKEKMKQALQLAPDNAEVLTAVGRDYYLLKDFKNAQSTMQKAIALNPHAFLPRIDLADLYLNVLHKPKEAVDAYQSALAILPDHGGAHFGYGKALAAIGKIDKAIQELQRAAELSPETPLPYQLLSQLYVSQKDWDGAVKFFDSVLEKKPDLLPPRIALGDVFLTKGQPEKAVAAYQAAVRISPRFALGQYKLGEAYQSYKRWEDAESAYLLAIQNDERLAPAYNNLAWMAVERKSKLDDALNWAKKAVELAPEVPNFQDTLAWVHRARGELDKAASILEKVSANPSGQADVYYHLGVVYHELGKPAQARKALEKVLLLDKKYVDAALLLKEIK